MFFFFYNPKKFWSTLSWISTKESIALCLQRSTYLLLAESDALLYPPHIWKQGSKVLVSDGRTNTWFGVLQITRSQCPLWHTKGWGCFLACSFFSLFPRTARSRKKRKTSSQFRVNCPARVLLLNNKILLLNLRYSQGSYYSCLFNTI